VSKEETDHKIGISPQRTCALTGLENIDNSIDEKVIIGYARMTVQGVLPQW
jgi:hypothetical protein